MHKINICIVHYNTPKLTECLIKSINKFTPNCRIYIFDNSDKSPFTYRQDNIIYFDNTKGQIINFEEWIKKYPHHQSIYYSAKHCYTIQKCIEKINEPFILLDSDVLLKCDVSKIWDESLAFVGEISEKSKRVYPFVCFLNPSLLKKYNVKYFDEKRMWGIDGSSTIVARDTGAALYFAKGILPHKKIQYSDFIVHYAAGSYAPNVFNILHKGQISKEVWLEKNKPLWEDGARKNIILNDIGKNGMKLEETHIRGIRNLAKRFGANIDNPKTITDKLNWLKLYDVNELKVKCADKIRVREYCEEKLGKDICVPILKIYDKPEDIDFSELPNEFVLKCNHGSSFNIIVKDKTKENITADKSKLKGWLSKDFALNYFYEMHYHYINKKCYAEKMLGDNIVDYKFWCFNGEPKFFTMGAGGGHGAINHYDMNGKFLPELSRVDYPSDPSKKYEIPDKFNEMVSYAKKLSEDFKFVRVDFYYVDGQIYLGELTFIPGAGSVKYRNSNANIMVGNMLNLGNQPAKKEKRGVVYTCITGDYESLAPLSVKNDNFDYICYTDKDVKSDFWEVRQIPEKIKNLDNKRINRYIKTHPHEFFQSYDLSIYIDGNVDIKKDLNSFVDNYCQRSKGVIFAGQHPVRKCIYKEAEAVVHIKKDTSNNVTPQMEKYKKEGFPKEYGLTQNCILIRYHNDEACKRVMETWWEEISTESYRDQLSLFYSLWKNKDAKYTILDKSLFDGPVFVWEKSHKKNRTRTTVVKNTSSTISNSENAQSSAAPNQSFIFGDTILSGNDIKTRTKYKPQPIKFIGRNRPRTKSMKAILSL